MNAQHGVLEISFSTDWHIGTGLGQSGGLDRLLAREPIEVFDGVDADPVTWDVPYLPAKSITGMLRDAAERLAFGLDGGGEREWSNLVDLLFGSVGSSNDRGTQPRRASLSVRPGRCTDPEAAEAAFDGDRLSASRSSTSLTALGVARDHTLRIIEVGRADAVFEAPIVVMENRFVGSDSPTILSFIVVAVALVEAMGAGRRRGMGRCSVRILDLPDYRWPSLADAVETLRSAEPPIVIDESLSTNDHETSSRSGAPVPVASSTVLEIAVDIQCLTPVIATPAVQGNVVRSADHLPGRMLLPFVIERLERAGIDATGGLRRGDLSVEHGYPVINGRRSAPMPFAFSELKRSGAGEDRYWNTFLAPPPSQAKQVRSGFIASGPDGTLLRTVTNFDVRTHNSVNDEMQRPDESVGGLFTYQAIAAGSCFRVIVRCRIPDSEDDQVMAARIINALNGEASIGTSRKDDYGSVLVTASMSMEPTSGSSIPANTPFLLWCTAPVVVVDPSDLRPTPTVEAVAKALSDSIEATGVNRPVAVVKAEAVDGLADVRLRTDRIEGFHSRWGLPQPSLPVVGAGSVLRLRCDVELDAAAIATIERNGIGLRSVEGFGRVRFDPVELSLPSHRQFVDVRSSHGRRIDAARPHSAGTSVKLLERVRDVQLSQLRIPDSRGQAPTASRIGELRAQLVSGNGGPGVHPALAWLEHGSSTRTKAARWGMSLEPLRRLLSEGTGQGSLRSIVRLDDDHSLTDNEWRDGVIELLDHLSGLRKRGSDGQE